MIALARADVLKSLGDAQLAVGMTGEDVLSTQHADLLQRHLIFALTCALVLLSTVAGVSSGVLEVPWLTCLLHIANGHELVGGELCGLLLLPVQQLFLHLLVLVFQVADELRKPLGSQSPTADLIELLLVFGQLLLKLGFDHLLLVGSPALRFGVEVGHPGLSLMLL